MSANKLKIFLPLFLVILVIGVIAFFSVTFYFSENNSRQQIQNLIKKGNGQPNSSTIKEPIVFTNLAKLPVVISNNSATDVINLTVSNEKINVVGEVVIDAVLVASQADSSAKNINVGFVYQNTLSGDSQRTLNLFYDKKNNMWALQYKRGSDETFYKVKNADDSLSSASAKFKITVSSDGKEVKIKPKVGEVRIIELEKSLYDITNTMIIGARIEPKSKLEILQLKVSLFQN